MLIQVIVLMMLLQYPVTANANERDPELRREIVRQSVIKRKGDAKNYRKRILIKRKGDEHNVRKIPPNRKNTPRRYRKLNR